jgi:hypothetical protein
MHRLGAIVTGERLCFTSLRGLLAAGFARAQHVQADARDHGCQPRCQVLDLAGVGTAEPEPGFLNSVVGLSPRAQHPISHSSQMSPVRLKLLCQPFFLVHWSHFPGAIRHGYDEGNPIGVTTPSNRESGRQKSNPDMGFRFQQGT